MEEEKYKYTKWEKILIIGMAIAIPLGIYDTGLAIYAATKTVDLKEKTQQIFATNPEKSELKCNNHYFTLEKTPINAGIVDAVNRGSNIFEITTENVKRFSLWLHPKMVDFSQSVEVIVNGEKNKYSATPSLFDALRSYDRRKDWGLIYYAEVVITVGE